MDGERQFYSFKQKKLMREIDAPVEALQELHHHMDTLKIYNDRLAAELNVLYKLAGAASKCCYAPVEDEDREHALWDGLYAELKIAEKACKRTAVCCGMGESYSRDYLPWDYGEKG